MKKRNAWYLYYKKLFPTPQHCKWVCRFLGPVVGMAFASPRVQDARRYLPPSSSSSVRLEEETLWDFQSFWELARPRQSSFFEVPIEIFSVFLSPLGCRPCMVLHAYFILQKDFQPCMVLHVYFILRKNFRPCMVLHVYFILQKNLRPCMVLHVYFILQKN